MHPHDDACDHFRVSVRRTTPIHERHWGWITFHVVQYNHDIDCDQLAFISSSQHETINAPLAQLFQPVLHREISNCG